MEKQFILAVPNFSNGRDQDVIDAVTAPFKGKEGITLVSVEPEHDFNRTVITAIGEPEPLKKALLEMAAKSYELIDMTKQKGTHPRIGAQDTIPLFPLANIELEECVKLADEIGEELYEKHGVPIFFSAENARTEDKKSISFKKWKPISCKHCSIRLNRIIDCDKWHNFKFFIDSINKVFEI